MASGNWQNALSRFFGAAIYLALVIVGAVLFFWGFLFAVGAMIAIALFYAALRLFGIAPPRKRRQPGQRPEQSNQEDVIELKKRDDGSYE
ncbi:hypothetical protein [Permianibacter aggregans]|uniref:Uncharacterized protein n=1 Tax=Permianibacter aggregans TaxID=1510150 RepID=A0A4R6UYF7_9GAMM|nr:hypothetical protein [Permianibacter aggregans]QGX38341.1 hypothetical protein E2H98_01130 [Permianibacter aggregans]TDQ48664.1 hypothetical protein EV696_106104 [Permianibacter aggregans]